MRKEFAIIKAIEFNHNERYCKIMILASLGYFGQFSGSTCELILKIGQRKNDAAQKASNLASEFGLFGF